MNTTVDFVVYLLLARGVLGFRLHYLLANVVAFLFAVSNSFLLNRRWTFRSSDARKTLQFTKLFSVNVVSLALYEGLLAVLVEGADFHDVIAKALSYGIVLLWNFSAYKYWTFRERPRIL